MQHLQPNTLLQGGRYRIIKTLGQGGFGITYLAIQNGLERKVAVKEFFMKELCERDSVTSHVSVGSTGSIEMVRRFKEKFLKEAQLIAGMDNNHIVRIHDIFEENGTAYYIMENIDGGSVDSLVNNGALSESKALVIIKEIGSALEYIHNQNILHLDVKPSNILIRRNGEAVLIDFGISKRYDAEGGQTSTTPVGISKGYAPIEQYNQGLHNFSPATDVYSLGATLFKLLTGKTPPEAPMLLDEEDFPKCPFNVSKYVWSAIEKAMEPRKKKRYQSIADFLNSALNQVQTVNSISKETTIIAPKHTNSTIIDAPSNKQIGDEEDATVILESNSVDNNGYDYVDLGLSVKWAKCNLGAKTEFDKGDFYSFSPLIESKDLPSNICGHSEYDICRKTMGGAWRLPTNEEMIELRTKCTWEFDYQQNAYKITGPNGNYIYLPVTHVQIGIGSCLHQTGKYWTGNLHVYNKQTAYLLYFDAFTADKSWRNELLGSECAIRGAI